jgi:hypothetical protein
VAPLRFGIPLVLCFALLGCGGGSDSQQVDAPMIAAGVGTANCGSAALGVGDPDWRRRSTWVSRFGVYGTGRDFRTAQKSPVRDFHGLRQRQVHGPILITKTPFVVEGKAPVTVEISPHDRRRAGIVAGIPFGGGPYAGIRFTPCPGRPRTGWPGGWFLRDQQSVTISVKPENEGESRLVVGRP